MTQSGNLGDKKRKNVMEKCDKGTPFEISINHAITISFVTSGIYNPAIIFNVQSPLVIVDSSVSGKLFTITRESTITREIHAKIDIWSA